MSYRTFREMMIREAARKQLPILGEFELTARCNFRCAMCFVVNQKAHDLSTETWKKIFDDAVKNGLTFALLTGGEIMLRDDFSELYDYLFDQGVKITLYTNGALVSEKIINTLKKRPPEFIAITLYGANNETYEKITRGKEGFTKVNQGIDLLNQANLNVILRILPLASINDELDQLIAYAKHKNLTLHYSNYIGPDNEGCNAYKDLRLSPAKMLEFSRNIDKAFGREAKKSLSTQASKGTCAALRSAYFINHQGKMQACAMAYTPTKSILDSDIKTVFKDLAHTLRQIETHQGCLSCAYFDLCNQCYARRLLEGNINACNSYLKAYAILKGGDDLA